MVFDNDFSDFVGGVFFGFFGLIVGLWYVVCNGLMGYGVIMGLFVVFVCWRGVILL